jgi:hypothetical protein
VVYALLSWGIRHRGTNSRLFMHSVCGTVLDQAGRCPKCELTPGPAEIDTRPVEGRKRLRSDPVSIALRAPHHLLEPIET